MRDRSVHDLVRITLVLRLVRGLFTVLCAFVVLQHAFGKLQRRDAEWKKNERTGRINPKEER
ncbi:hypothetical protein K474DRAFT_1317141 [Panus rudis PR-1116 ss-1]|nr:hypothetical protein K474DRAFT_1317141 [Panus rudis PR-1116 ss-1]